MCPKYEKSELTCIFLNKNKAFYIKRVANFIKKMKKQAISKMKTRSNNSKKIDQKEEIIHEASKAESYYLNQKNSNNEEIIHYYYSESPSQSQFEIVNINVNGSQSEKEDSYIQIESQNSFLKKRQKDYSDQLDDETNQNSQFMRFFLEGLRSKTNVIKNNFKRSLNIQQGQKFRPQSEHQCPFCPKKFEKPCSLGGHISKLHTGQKKLLKEENAKNIELTINKGFILRNLKTNKESTY